MKSLLVALLVFLPLGALAQKLEKITGLKVEYWRAFHGVIKQVIFFSPSGEIALNTDVMRGMTDAEREQNTKHTVKLIKRPDLASTLALFNYADVRAYFAATKPDDRLDGSFLSITVVQNSFSITFTTQDAFTRGSSKYATALGRVALELFKKADVSIPKDELY